MYHKNQSSSVLWFFTKKIMTPKDQLILKNLNELSESGVEVAYNNIEELRKKIKNTNKAKQEKIIEDQRMEQWINDQIETNTIYI